MATLQEESSEALEAELAQPIAPWPHTAFLLIVLILWAAYSAFRSTLPASVMPHYITYSSSIIMQSLLVGATIAGLYHRRQFIAGIFGNFTRQGLLRDAAIGVVTYIGANVVSVFIATVTSLSGLHLTRRTDVVHAMAPHSLAELALWLLVSLSAGLGEEFVFRGYLQQQLSRWFRSTPTAILFASLLFGCLHFYQGAVGVLQVIGLAIVYGIVAARRGNLRSVMFAHFLQDFTAGAMLFLHNH